MLAVWQQLELSKWLHHYCQGRLDTHTRARTHTHTQSYTDRDELEKVLNMLLVKKKKTKSKTYYAFSFFLIYALVQIEDPESYKAKRFP